MSDVVCTYDYYFIAGYRTVTMEYHKMMSELDIWF